MATLQQILDAPDSKPAKSLQAYTRSRSGYVLKIPTAEQREVSESTIQSEIIHFLKSQRVWVVKYPATHIVGGSRVVSGVVGTPDLLACYRGHFIGIEVKKAAKGVRVSGEQVAQGELIQKAGGFWTVAHSVKQVSDLLGTIDKLDNDKTSS